MARRRFQTLSLQVAAPAAGAGLTYAFSTVQRVKLRSLVFTFTASATVANRNVWAALVDPSGLQVYEVGYGFAITAGTAYDHVLSPTFGSPVEIQGKGNPTFGLPWPDMWLPPAWQLQLGAVNIQAGDQIGAANFVADYSEDVWHQDQDAAAFGAYLQSLT